MEAYTNGVVRKLIAKEGDTIPMADDCVIGSPDRTSRRWSSGRRAGGTPLPRPRPPSAQAPRRARRPARAAAPARAGRRPPRPRPGAGAEGGRGLRASPLALRMAADAGIDIGTLKGTGPQGRIIRRDIEAASSRPRRGGPRPPPSPSAKCRRSSCRRCGARSRGAWCRARRRCRNFYLTGTVRMERAWGLQGVCATRTTRLASTDVVVKPRPARCGATPR